MKKRSIASLIIIILAVVIYSQRATIALRVLPIAIEQALSADKIEQLGDGLHIALCGAGGPMPSATRSGPCVAVVAAGKLFLVDAGSNGVRNLARMGYAPGDISGVFLTHFHSDHIDGLGEVGLVRWAGASHSEPLNVYGPEGVADIVNGFNSAIIFNAAIITNCIVFSGVCMFADGFMIRRRIFSSHTLGIIFFRIINDATITICFVCGFYLNRYWLVIIALISG